VSAAASLALSIDLDEWYHSRRWVDGRQKAELPDTAALFARLYNSDRPAGEILAPTRSLLDLFDRYGCRCTFFVLGEVAEWYPDLVREIAARGHEIACHGQHHVDMTVLGPRRFADLLDRAVDLLTGLAGDRPVGYRAPNLVYEPWATQILEEKGFLYDSSVCVSRPIGGKYRGWSRAPLHPYHPSYDNVAESGAARLVELPIPCFPLIRVSAGSGIMTRVVGYYWTLGGLQHAIRRGNTCFYFHPWEVGARPAVEGHTLRNALFLRRTGPWMLRAVERLLQRFDGRIVTARESAESLLQADVSS
jgi:peptidoglycan/xylan/chitin deacetylase (PgdA/CDA1 family)